MERPNKDLVNKPLVESKIDPPKEKKVRAAKSLDRKGAQAQVSGFGDQIHGDEGDVNFFAMENLEKIRAERQPWYDQAANMLGQIVVGELVGGTIQGFGHLLDVQAMNDTVHGRENDFSNWMTELGGGIREWGEENMKIHTEEQDGSMNMSDSGWWFKNGVSVGSTLSLLIPSTAAMKGLSMAGKAMSKGARMLSKADKIAEGAQLASKGKWMANGIGQAILSRQMENSMEAQGTFQSKYDEYLKEGMDDSSAKELASEAAAFNYKAGWAMLVQDIPQYLLIGKVFNPITGKVEAAMSKAAKSGLKPGYKNAKKIFTGVAGAGSEGLEEAAQFVIAEEAGFLTDVKAGLKTQNQFSSRMKHYSKDEEMWTAALFGSLGGAVFQAVGPGAQDLIKGKKRKEFEKNYLKVHKEAVQNRSKSLVQRAQMVQEADESGDPIKMKQARESLNLQATLDAIEMDQYDTHIETLHNLKNASDEELVQFGEENEPLNKDLINQFVPDMIEQSNQLRSEYLKFRNRHGSEISRAMAMNMHNKRQFSKGKKEFTKVINNHYSEANIDAGQGGMTNHSTGKFKLRTQKQAHKRIDGWLKSRLTEPGADKDRINSQIKENEKRSKELLTSEQQFATDERTPRDKSRDQTGKILLEAFEEDLIQNEAGILMSDLAIAGLAQDMKTLGTKEHAAKVEKIKTDKEFEQLESIEEIDRGIESLESEENPYTGKDAQQNKEVTAQSLKDRKKVLEKKKEAKEAAEAREKVIDEANEEKAKAKAKAEDVNPVIEEDGTEDNNAIHDEDGNEFISKVQDKAIDTYVGQRNDIRVLDVGMHPGIPFTPYANYLLNGRDKTGDKIEYKLGTAVGTGKNPAETKKQRAEAIRKFKAGQLDDQVYRWLPLKVEFNDNADIFNYINDANIEDSEGVSKLGKGQKLFMDSEFLERKLIIQKMKEGPVVTEVAKQYGGSLVMDPKRQEGFVNNHLTDLMIDNNTIKTMEIFVSDKQGYLMNHKGELDQDMNHRMVRREAGNTGDATSSILPYAGGVYLKVPRANGVAFPLKVNLRMASEVEADIITDLIEAYILKGKENNLSKQSDIRDIKATHPELWDRINKETPAELEALLASNDTNINDFINMFVKMDDNTKGRPTALFQSGKFVRYVNPATGKEKAATAEDWAATREEVKAHIMTKRRQFKKSRWGYSKGHLAYRRMMIDQGIMSTDSITGEPLFQKGAGSTSIYAKSLMTESKETPAVVDGFANNVGDTVSLKGPKGSNEYAITSINHNAQRTIIELASTKTGQVVYTTIKKGKMTRLTFENSDSKVNMKDYSWNWTGTEETKNTEEIFKDGSTEYKIFKNGDTIVAIEEVPKKGDPFVTKIGGPKLKLVKKRYEKSLISGQSVDDTVQSFKDGIAKTSEKKAEVKPMSEKDIILAQQKAESGETRNESFDEANNNAAVKKLEELGLLDDTEVKKDKKRISNEEINKKDEVSKEDMDKYFKDENPKNLFDC